MNCCTDSRVNGIFHLHGCFNGTPCRLPVGFLKGDRTDQNSFPVLVSNGWQPDMADLELGSGSIHHHPNADQDNSGTQPVEAIGHDFIDLPAPKN